MELNILFLSVWGIIGFIISIQLQYLHTGLHCIKKKNLIMLWLGILLGPITLAALIASYKKSTDLYVPKYLRYGRSRITRLPLKDKHIFNIWRQTEKNIEDFSKLLYKIWDTGYFKEESLVIKYINNRYRDYKLYCKVEYLKSLESDY